MASGVTIMSDKIEDQVGWGRNIKKRMRVPVKTRVASIS